MEKDSNIKMVQEVNRRRIELIVYASYIAGYMACNDGKLITHRECLEEINRLVDLISSDN